MNCVPIDMLPTQGPLLPTQGPLLPTPWAGKSVEVYFTLEHSFMDCTAQRLHARTSVTSYTSDIYNLNSRLAHLYALWMEYVRFELESWRNILMSTSQGTYVRIEQTSEAIRVTYQMCVCVCVWGGGAGIENRWFTHSVSSSRSCLPGCS